MLLNRRESNARNAERGSATFAILLVVVLMIGMAGAILLTRTRTNAERLSMVEQHRARAAADAGIARAQANLATRVMDDLGSPDEPIAFGGGSYWVDVVDGGEEIVTVTSTATVGGETAALEAVFNVPEGGVFANAIFAGNSSGDPAYSLDLGGDDAQADAIVGDVYCGGDVTLVGDADVDGTIRAIGSITGGAGESGESQPLPNLAAPDYPNTADVKVVDEFAAAVYAAGPSGDSAFQLAESNPAHIFRKNPSDRVIDTSKTTKDDYFLEDPYEDVKSDSASDGSDAYEITLAGMSGQPGSGGNQAVYYIDGNLWLHNKKTFSFKISHDASESVQVTFVVKGNIYFSDNLFYQDLEKDGVCFIAMEDAAESDSGNIYFGDPVFGTLEEMHAFMYAENDFKDTNLSATGSAVVELRGNMTAGNQVVIQRDFGLQHSKLGVAFDDRIATGDLVMPGLPPWNEAEPGELVRVSWRPVRVQ